MPLIEHLQNRGWRKPALVIVPLLLAGVVVILVRQQSVHRISVRAPVAQDTVLAVVMNDLSPSVFTVPVQVELGPLVEEVERALPRTFGDIAERKPIDGRDDLEAAFQVERGSIRASFVDSTAILSTTLTYSARAWYDPPVLPEMSASCGTGDESPRPRLSVSLVTPLTLDRDWRLRSRLRAGTIKPATTERRDRCTVTVLDFDMTGQVIGAANDLVDQMGPRADSAIAAIDVRRHFQEWWDLIARPVRLADDVWLMLTPEAVGRDAIRGTGKGIETSLTLRARPRVVISAGRPEVGETPIPPLETVEGEEGLRIFAEAQADYAELAVLMRDELGDRDFSAAGRTLQIREIEIQGVGDGRISVALGVTGDVVGDLYLVGTPVYDPPSDVIAVPDLNFDVGTREALVSGAAWVARLGLAELFREKARWPSEPAVDWARTQVEAGFNSRLSDEVRLEGTVESVSVLGVTAGKESLRIRAEVRGNARLIVSQAGGG